MYLGLMAGSQSRLRGRRVADGLYLILCTPYSEFVSNSLKTLQFSDGLLGEIIKNVGCDLSLGYYT